MINKILIPAALFLFTIKPAFPWVEIDSIAVTANFTGPFNKTIAELFLSNNTDLDSLEGVIVFQINKTAFIENLWLETGGSMKKAETLERVQGERVYNQITRKKIDPALLIKAGNGIYRLSVYPFLGHQRRKVILEYYSVLETDSEDLPSWSFNLKYCDFSASFGSGFTINSTQQEETKVYIKNENEIHEIKSGNSGNISAFYGTRWGRKNQILFDFRNVKGNQVYYLDTLKFLQMVNLNDSVKSLLSETHSRILLNDQVRISDFIFLLTKKLAKGEKPYVIQYFKDEFLDGFLDYLAEKNKILLEKHILPAWDDQFITDDYHWKAEGRNWKYSDINFLLSTNITGGSKTFNKGLKCSYLDKFTKYLESLKADIKTQRKNGFLNSFLAKLVIEEDSRAVKIWEDVTGENYKPAGQAEEYESGADYSSLLFNTSQNYKRRLNPEPSYFVAVEEMPEPIGGIDTIKKSFFFPEILKKFKGGKIYILAFISKTGDIKEFRTLKLPGETGTFSSLVQKLSRFSICFPGWKPGKQRGKPLNVQICVPIKIITDSVSSSGKDEKANQYRFDKRIFNISVPDTGNVILVEKNFNSRKSKNIKTGSPRYYELLLKNPDIVSAVYNALYLSDFDKLSFISKSENGNYYSITGN